MTGRREFHPLQAQEIARARSLTAGLFRVANLRDVIASKQTSGQQKDLVDPPLLEDFRREFEKQHPAALRAATDIAADLFLPPHAPLWSPS